MILPVMFLDFFFIFLYLNVQYRLFKLPVKNCKKKLMNLCKETRKINSTLLKSTNVCQNVITAVDKEPLDEQTSMFMGQRCWQA